MLYEVLILNREDVEEWSINYIEIVFVYYSKLLSGVTEISAFTGYGQVIRVQY